MRRTGKGTYELRLSSVRLARMVVIDALRTVWLEDNAFDLLPGMHRIVRVKGTSRDVRGLRATALNS